MKGTDHDTAGPDGFREKPIVIRLADRHDGRALVRLAERDSSEVPFRPLLVAEVDGELRAALPVAGGRAIADPFHRTAELVQLLKLRAAQL